MCIICQVSAWQSKLIDHYQCAFLLRQRTRLCPFHLNIDIYVVYIDVNIARIYVVKSM